jgi:hypothetical protein
MTESLPVIFVVLMVIVSKNTVATTTITATLDTEQHGSSNEVVQLFDWHLLQQDIEKAYFQGTINT